MSRHSLRAASTVAAEADRREETKAEMFFSYDINTFFPWGFQEKLLNYKNCEIKKLGFPFLLPIPMIVFKEKLTIINRF